MVVLNKIYTRTGDSGETALGNGERVAKNSLRVSVYGTSDELNSAVGLVRLHCEGEIDLMLARIQNDLFDLGADLCNPGNNEDSPSESTSLRIVSSQVERLELEIDSMNEHLQPLRSFVLPGGSAVSSYLHFCRTVARRAERLSTELSSIEFVNPQALKYLNRLSDWFFVASRVYNGNGNDDVLWVPGANR